VINYLKQIPIKACMKYFSLFSGIGGFELGLERAAAKHGIETDCVGYSEIDLHALATYKEHFDHDNFGDATRIDAGSLPDFLKTSGDWCTTTMDELSKPSSPPLMGLGMWGNGRCSTLKISVSRKAGTGLSLSAILEPDPDPKYFLSPGKVAGILRSASQQKPQLLEHLPAVATPEATTPA
jgi:hypothetical protein